MSKNRVLIFRLIAGFVSLYHLTLGVLGLFSGVELMAPVISSVYGVTPVFDSQFLYMAKFISAYFIAFGLMMGFVAYDPYRYRNLALVGATLFLIRFATRIYYFNLLQNAFVGITLEKNLLVSVPIALLSVGLFVFLPKENKEKNRQR